MKFNAKKLFLLTLFSLTFLVTDTYAFNEEMCKVYVLPEQIWIDDSGIYIRDNMSTEISVVSNLFSDETGVYTLQPTQLLFRNCTEHGQICNLCLGCARISCIKRCPKPNACQKRK